MAIPLSVNIDIKSDTVNKAMDLIAKAGYVLYEPTRIKRKAQAKAEAKLITVKNETKISLLQKQALNRVLTIETSRQENINNISHKALTEITSTGKQIDPLVDTDWIRKYFSFSQDISNEEMQKLWSKILAGELTNAGNFSYKTMSILANMRKQEAELYSRLSSFVVVVNNFRLVPLVFADQNGEGKYNQNIINFEELQNLESLGLIHFNEIGNFNLTISNNKDFIIDLGNKKYIFKYPESKINLDVGCALLTKEGQELFIVIDHKGSPDLIEIIKKRWLTSDRSIAEL